MHTHRGASLLACYLVLVEACELLLRDVLVQKSHRGTAHRHYAIQQMTMKLRATVPGLILAAEAKLSDHRSVAALGHAG